jgi:hypothetical protein
MRPIYRRPPYRVKECFGLQSLATIDVAVLLIQMERLGFEIDPITLAEPIAERLKKNSHLNDAELTVFWYQRERNKNAPVTLVVDPKTIGDKAAEIRTRTNYRVELWKGPDGRPTMLQSFAPKYRASRKPWRWAA